MSKERLGLIAGNGKFPLLFAQKAKSLGYRVTAAGIKGDTSLFMKFLADDFELFYVGDLRKLFDYFKSRDVKKVIMAGQVNPENLFEKHVELDEDFKQLFEAIKDRKADTIFTAVADKLQQEGMELLDSTTLLKDNIATAGVLTKRAPTDIEKSDIEFGREIAKQMGKIDIGQTVVIKEKAIVAIEAMEGTDATIRRGGKISREGAVIVKMSKPEQDLRFDVPVIGPKTIHSMIRANAACLAIEAGKTILIEPEKLLPLADKAGISIVAV